MTWATPGSRKEKSKPGGDDEGVDETLKKEESPLNTEILKSLVQPKWAKPRVMSVKKKAAAEDEDGKMEGGGQNLEKETGKENEKRQSVGMEKYADKKETHTGALEADDGNSNASREKLKRKESLSSASSSSTSISGNVNRPQNSASHDMAGMEALAPNRKTWAFVKSKDPESVETVEGHPVVEKDPGNAEKTQNFAEEVAVVEAAENAAENSVALEETSAAPEESDLARTSTKYGWAKSKKGAQPSPTSSPILEAGSFTPPQVQTQLQSESSVVPDALEKTNGHVPTFEQQEAQSSTHNFAVASTPTTPKNALKDAIELALKDLEMPLTTPPMTPSQLTKADKLPLASHEPSTSREVALDGIEKPSNNLDVLLQEMEFANDVGNPYEDDSDQWEEVETEKHNMPRPAKKRIGKT
jgi:hypothetical protein